MRENAVLTPKSSIRFDGAQDESQLLVFVALFPNPKFDSGRKRRALAEEPVAVPNFVEVTESPVVPFDDARVCQRQVRLPRPIKA